MVFLTVFILGGIIILCVYYSSYKRNQKEISSHPMHFDLLDENGDPIKEPKIKVEVDGGNSDVPVQKLKYFCIKDKGHHVTVWPNGYDQFDIVEFNIAGMSHRDNIDNYLGEFIATLEPETSNIYDANAIKILAPDGHHVGYVPRDFTDAIRDIRHLPCSCYCYIGCNSDTYFSDCYIVID